MSFRSVLPPAVLALLLLGAPPAHAGWEMDAPINLFLDRSLILFSPTPIRREGDPRSPAPLLFEAQVAPNLFFPQLSMGGLREPGGEWALSFVLTPHIRLRMLNEESSPVIPPSFMPKVTIQLLHLRLLERPGSARLRALGMGANLIIGHYSNGQTGCFYGNQVGSDPDCTPAEGALPLNETTGDFSTNFIRWEGHARLVLGLDGETQTGWVVGGNLALELNSAIGPGGITAQMRSVYGDGHARVQAVGERLWRGHRFQLTAALSRPFGGVDGQGNTVTVEAAAMPRWAAGFGLYAAFVHGRDYYNILFLEPVRLWQFGLAFELGPGARIREAITQHSDNHP
jgi:hypothetical protein